MIRRSLTIPKRDSSIGRYARWKSNVPLTAQQKDYKQLQPLGIQNLLNDSNLHDIYKKYLTRSTYAATLEPMENAWSLPPEIYIDFAFAKVEKEKVFKQSWIAIDHKSSHLSKHGDVLSTFVGDTPILITNNKGTLKGFYNVCRHRGSKLLDEGKYKNCNVIRCRYHSWGFACDGKLAGAPYFNDDRMPKNKLQRSNPDEMNELMKFDKINFNKEEYGLFEIGVKEFMGTLYVNLNPDQQQRDSLWKYQFGDLYENYGHYPYDDMRTIEQFEYKIEANWKLVAENFIEYYHLPWVHPELCEVSSVANHIRRQGVGQYTGFATYPLSYGGTPADPDAFIPFKGLNNVDLEASWFIQVFPNISYWLFPHHMVTLITAPTSDPGVTKEKMTVSFDKTIKEKIDNPQSAEDEEIRRKVKELTDFYVMVNGQDIDAVENLQKGLIANNVYRGGRLSAKFEEPIYRFQHILIDYLTDEYMKEYPGDKDFVHSQYLEKEI